MGSSNGMCLRFWYHMQGAHIGTLNVYLKIIGISQSILWSLSNAQGNNWLQAQVPISNGRRNFQASFMAQGTTVFVLRVFYSLLCSVV